ncbi:MAG: polysulfide reductase NrfD [Proteobacteria bacterium]|nr:polysulfide reductase NrfD [Pseudomonadota bacterium]
MIQRIKDKTQLTLDAMEGQKRFYIWITCLLSMILLCGFALLASLVLSMEILEFSIKIPWAGMIAAYVFLVASGSGLCIINALGPVFGMHRYEIMGKRIAFLSLTLIVFGMLFIVLHLGHPERMPIYNAISPNFRSAISWMGALYSGYLMFVGLELYLLIRPDLYKKAMTSNGHIKTILTILTLEKFKDSYVVKLLESPKCHQVIGTLAFVAGISALSMLGSVFAHSESRILWYGPYYPAYFIVSAIFCGYAFLIIMTIISYKTFKDPMPAEVKSLIFEMAQVLALLLAVGLLFIACRMALALFNPLLQGPVLLLLTGPFKIGFWGGEIMLMSILSVFVLLWGSVKKSLAYVLSGSVMVLAGAFVMRYQFVVAGQIFPNIREGLPSYLPTLMEIFVLIGVFATFFLVYTLGEKYLSLKETISCSMPEKRNGVKGSIQFNRRER